MEQTTARRELFSMDVFGVPLEGTYHFAASNERNRTGILLLAGLSTPRAAHGDSSDLLGPIICRFWISLISH